MSKLDKAAQVIAAAELPGRVLHESQALAVASTLADAGLLASMAYEYSVEHLRAGAWLPRENSETHLAEWWDNRDDAEDVAESEYRAFGDTARIVCRLVGRPEVCE